MRKKPTKVRLMDFKSMYPTIFELMDLWKFLIAEKVEHYDSTEETKQLVSGATLNSFTHRSLYPKLATIVQILPEDDILPVRAHYGEDKSVYNMGVNHLTSEIPLWYSLADVIASKLLTGKTPKIIRAISFRPVGTEHNFQSVQIPGGLALTPQDDLIRSLIEHRIDMQHRRGATVKNTEEYERLDVIQEQLKILANATSYGIFIEIITEDRATKVQAYGLSPFTAKVNKTESLEDTSIPFSGTC